MNIHTNYDRLNNETRRIVDEAYRAMTGVLMDNSIAVSGNDDAEKCVDAISAFVISSGNEDRVLPDCATCENEGVVMVDDTQYVTRDMAIDAGDLALEGQPIPDSHPEPCPDCERGSR